MNIEEIILAELCIADVQQYANQIVAENWHIDEHRIAGYAQGIRICAFGGTNWNKQGEPFWQEADRAISASLQRWDITEESVDLMKVARHVLTECAAKAETK